MNFLAPLFLVGAAAIAGPILYHLIRRSTRQRALFSSLMFLQPSPPRLSRRHRFEHLLLLLLRCLALALLVLGFARPFFTGPTPIDPMTVAPQRTLVLLDVSASMRRSGLWEQAKSAVIAELNRAGPADQVALFTFDRAATALLTFEEWSRTAASERLAVATNRLDATTPGWAGTQLGHALITAAESVAETEGTTPVGSRRIVLVSDLQAGSRIEALQAYTWPKDVALTVVPIKAAHPTNAGVQTVAEPADANRSAGPTVRVRVLNSPDATREQFQLGWGTAEGAAAFIGAPIDAYVPPGQSRVFTLPVPEGSRRFDRITLRGDDDAFDNTAFVLPPERVTVGVLWLGSDTADDTRQSLFFLRRAFSDTPRVTVHFDARRPSDSMARDTIDAAQLVFVADALSDASAALVRDAVREGKTAVVLLKSADAAPTLAALLERDNLAVEDVVPSRYAMFGEINFQHPLFAPFSDPRFSDFTKIHVWKYRRVDFAGIPAARVIAALDNGDPAVVEIPRERGRLIVFTTGWQPDDSQIAISSKFVPLMWSLLENTGMGNRAPVQALVGDSIALASGVTAVRRPDGTTQPIEAGVTSFQAASGPGIYTLTAGSRTSQVAVNLDPNESRTAPLSLEDIEHLGVPARAASSTEPKIATAAAAAQLRAAEAENRQKLWRWLIAATLVVLLVESAVAGWTARRVRTTEGEVLA